jgi:hypothetical protein
MEAPMRIVKPILAAALVVTVQIANAAPALAQGCILLRQTSPLFGTAAPNQEAGTWNVTFTARHSTADKHYNGSVRQVQRELEHTYVVNRQNSLTATISYQLSPRLSLNAGIPFIEASWGIPSPRSGGEATRANENANGLGDITTLARFSLFKPSTHHTWNFQIGGGVKFPTGNRRATDVFPDGNGNNNLERYVDISVQPGDGGWGVLLDLQGFKSMGRFLAFGSATWLANPKDTGTASRGNLVTNTTPSNVNTVSDQFIFRTGTTVSLIQKKGAQVAASIAWRMEGVPRYDAIGASHGFRRPGVTMYWEPGITIMGASGHAVSFNMPIGYYYNRFRNPYTGNPGDSTFPEYVAIATYSMPLRRPAAKEPVRMDHTPPDPPSPAPKKQGSGTDDAHK